MARLKRACVQQPLCPPWRRLSARAANSTSQELFWWIIVRTNKKPLVKINNPTIYVKIRKTKRITVLVPTLILPNIKPCKSHCFLKTTEPKRRKVTPTRAQTYCFSFALILRLNLIGQIWVYVKVGHLSKTSDRSERWAVKKFFKMASEEGSTPSTQPKVEEKKEQGDGDTEKEVSLPFPFAGT